MAQQDEFRLDRRGNTRQRSRPSITVEVAELWVINSKDLVGTTGDQVSNTLRDIGSKGYDGYRISLCDEAPTITSEQMPCHPEQLKCQAGRLPLANFCDNHQLGHRVKSVELCEAAAPAPRPAHEQWRPQGIHRPPRLGAHSSFGIAAA